MVETFQVETLQVKGCTSSAQTLFLYFRGCCVVYTQAQPHLTPLYPAMFGIRVAFGVAMRSTWDTEGRSYGSFCGLYQSLT
jgi:hypothetical protein